MAKKSYPSNVVTLKIDGNKYTGHFESKKRFLGTQNNMEGYIIRRARGELQELILGSKKNLTIMPLNQEEQIEMDRLESLWQLAESKSLNEVTVGIFQKLVKK